ncbi:uncharacterized protein LOC112569160 [Pomacea canaliculata]|uniref:uncharacterized protein LOC112569160 n=1 Tax=Pomacea canaliculata TaxID=400727 RepID=UPI000D731A35|nr:uncharacterized protein LOC112569160 [Pomacea canaliculata]
MYDMIKWPLDYFLQAWDPATQEFVAQIGDSDVDHAYWGRPEDMTMPRPCYKVSPKSPGADLAGEAAACLALGSIIFRDKGDTTYADRLLDAAKSLYAFGKQHPGNYTEAIPEHARAYTSGGYKDEMCEGGIWLYRATNDTQYLVDAKSYYENNIAWALFYEYKQTACQLLLYEETGDRSYKDVVVQFMDSYMPDQMDYTPCGMAFRNEWGSNRYAGNTAFAALAAAEAGINVAEYRRWAVEQINVLLGDNRHDGGCFSYQIGYGTKYPLRPHHRASSCPDVPLPCSYDNLRSPDPSPHVLVGALVGGPKDAQGNYVDNREDYVGNEVAIDYNSGFQSALAGIIHLIATNNFPSTNNTCPCEN